MKKFKLFSLLAAALFCGGQGVMAEAPTTVYTVGDKSTLGTTWSTTKNQLQNYFDIDNTVIFNAYLCYSSASSQTWTSCSGSGSSSASYAALPPFPSYTEWGFNSYAGARTTRIYYFNVTNCTSVLVYGNSNKSGETLNLTVYELDPTTLETTGEAVGTVTIGDEDAVVSIENLDATKTYQAQVSGSMSGTNSAFYGIAFTYPYVAAAADDATLKDIMVNSKSLSDFDPENTSYDIELPYGTTEVPVVAATATSDKATVTITQATALNGTATIEVLAEDGSTTLTYTINFTVITDAIAHLTVVPFTNGAKGAIDEEKLTITAPYLAGTEVPTVKEEEIEVSGDGTPTATLNNDGTITLVGDDGKSSTYEVKVQVLAAADLGNDLITFTGEETYIFAPYTWDADKGWKFAKKVNEEGNMRDAKGNTRIYIALPPAESVALTSGSGANRNVIITVNGVPSNVTQTAASGEAITITLNQNADNFVVIESNQTGGDGGFTKLQLTGAQKPVSTSIEAATEVAPATKVVRDGQLLIIRDGKTYNAQGAVIE